MLVDISRLAEGFNMRSQTKPGKIDIKLRKPGYSIYQFIHCVKLQTSDYDVIFDFCVDSSSLATSFKKCNVIMT